MMDVEKREASPKLNERERRFLNRLQEKYDRTGIASPVRSYLLVGVVIMALFSLSRWIPWWGVALVTVEALGLLLFHQYKRFARFKSTLLTRLWRLARDTGV